MFGFLIGKIKNGKREVTVTMMDVMFFIVSINLIPLIETIVEQLGFVLFMTIVIYRVVK